MNNTTILITGADANRLAVLLNNQPGWRTVVAGEAEAAIEAFHRQHFDAVVLDDSLETTEEMKLRRIFLLHEPALVIYKVTGSADPGLAATIGEELKKARKANKPALIFTDDALKHAGLPITVQ